MKISSYSKTNSRYRGPMESKKINNNNYQILHEFTLLNKEIEKVKNKILKLSIELKEENNEVNVKWDSINKRIDKSRSDLNNE